MANSAEKSTLSKKKEIDESVWTNHCNMPPTTAEKGAPIRPTLPEITHIPTNTFLIGERTATKFVASVDLRLRSPRIRPCRGRGCHRAVVLHTLYTRCVRWTPVRHFQYVQIECVE